MGRFIVTYHVGNMAPDSVSVAAARADFASWAGQAGAAPSDPGEPVRSGTIVTRDSAHDGWLAGPLMGWSVIEAADRDTAARMLRNHPFVSRGCAVQVSEPV